MNRNEHRAARAAKRGTSEASNLYRVEGDWYGGGFGYTIPAASEEDARAWGERKARFHRDAVVTVTPREAARHADLALAAQFAGLDEDYPIAPREGDAS